MSNYGISCFRRPKASDEEFTVMSFAEGEPSHLYDVFKVDVDTLSDRTDDTVRHIRHHLECLRSQTGLKVSKIEIQWDECHNVREIKCFSDQKPEGAE